MNKRIDMVGQQYGQLTVVADAGADKKGQRRFLCRCTCGEMTTVVGGVLRRGLTRSCGCLRRTWAVKNRIGQVYGQLTVVAAAAPDKRGNRQFLCRCSCSRMTTVAGSSLGSGNTKSCGCLSVATVVARSTRHGCASRHAQTPEYRIWQAMWARCSNTRKHVRVDYAGRGITVCESWKSFETFLADMGPIPSPKHSIDRVNNDANYEPANCRWATRSQQSRNRRMLATNSSGVTGVSWNKRLSKWSATISGVPHGESHLGYFDNIEAAAITYSAARAERDCSY